MNFTAIILGILIIVFVVLVAFFTSKSDGGHCHGNCRACKYGDDGNCKSKKENFVDLKEKEKGDDSFVDTNNVYLSDDNKD